jgi:hypothetical protein
MPCVNAVISPFMRVAGSTHARRECALISFRSPWSDVVEPPFKGLVRGVIRVQTIKCVHDPCTHRNNSVFRLHVSACVAGAFNTEKNWP